MLRQLREDAREFPATMVLCVLWVAVFLLMVVNQAVVGPGLTLRDFLLGLRGGHQFGDLTLGELFQGEAWRTLTATFVHYGLLHIGLNLYALYQLGCLVESWYGAGQFVAIYVVTGGGGNLLSGLMRQALRYDPLVHSAGGSVVVMGLVGLCAVVGWRARTRLGDYLRDQMLWVILLTAGLGVALAVSGLPIIDNWGHACGALVGGLVGLANRKLVRQVGRRGAWWAGLAGSSLIAASAFAQVADDRKEAIQSRQTAADARQRWADGERWLFRLEEVRQLYRVVAAPRVIPRGSFSRTIPPVASRTSEGLSKGAVVSSLDAEHELYLAVVRATRSAFESMKASLGTGPTAGDYSRIKQLLEGSLRDPPSIEEMREFENRMGSLLGRVKLDRDVAKSRALGGAFGGPTATR